MLGKELQMSHETYKVECYAHEKGSTETCVPVALDFFNLLLAIVATSNNIGNGIKWRKSRDQISAMPQNWSERSGHHKQAG